MVESVLRSAISKRALEGRFKRLNLMNLSFAVALVSVALLASLPSAGVSTNPKITAVADPIPAPAVESILRAFDTHPLVAIGESHRNQQVHDFIVGLVSDPRFAEKVDDIVVEFGSADHQNIIDRFTEGQSIPLSELRRVWRDTVNILVWDAPVYERFFRSVRAINQRHRDRRLRVLLADPPLEWSSIGHEGWERIAGTRDLYAAALVEREVLATHRRALLIFGSGHVTRDSAYDAYGHAPDRKPNLAELLATDHPKSMLLIWAHMAGWATTVVDPRLATWPKPAMALLKGTWLGAINVGPSGQSPTLEQLADAFLYLGSTRRLTISKPAPQLYSDGEYLRELLRRDQIQGGFNASELEQLRKRFLK
jgi:hypothetical protein